MPLRHDLYLDPQFGGAGIATSWIEKARYTGRNPDRYRNDFEFQFDRFSTLWMAFNAWGVCVTLARTDASMIKMLGQDRDVAEVFYNILANTDLREGLARISHSFPLPSFTDLLRLDPYYNWRGDRDAAFWQKISMAPVNMKVRMSPPMNPENLIWGDVLECMYKVRCNLLHGGKMANRYEAYFVSVFSDLLEQLLSGRRNVLML